MAKQVHCANCGKEFRVTGTLREQQERHFCRSACYHDWRSGRKRGPYEGTYQAIKTCPACGKGFEATGPSGEKQIYCSRACYGMMRPYKGGVEVNELFPEEAAYVAGFIDGEGSVQMNMRDNGSVSLHLGITNTHRPTIEYLREVFGFGNITCTRKDSKRYKAVYGLSLNHPATASLLRQIAPYMITKRAQADLALEFAEKKPDVAFRADKAAQGKYHARMKKLNQRGNPDMEE